MPNLIGQSLGRYHILEQLGEGGMATVYKAYDTRLETEVAVKVIRTDVLPQNALERTLKRFEREAKSLARLTHPNIVKVMDYGDHDGAPYLVLVYLPGGTLKKRMGQSMPWQEAVRLLIPVANALDYAHEQKVVHRDVKPANILLTGRGQPMLTDFGIAKILEMEDGHTLTGTGMGIGTPEYMSPEQGVGREVDGRTDIYSMGIILYELITGRKPYTADTPMAVVVKHMTDPLPRPSQFVPDLPEAVEKVLIKSLAKDPKDRYPNADAFVTAMEALLMGVSQSVISNPVPRANRPAEPDLETQDTYLQEETTTTKPKTGMHPEAFQKTRATQTMNPPVRSQLKKFEWWPWVIGIGGLALLIFSVKTFTNKNLFSSVATPAPLAAVEVPGGVSTITGNDGMPLLYVPAGEFTMGNDSSDQPGEKPAHTVYLDAFWIDQTEVTNQLFSSFVEATGYQSQSGGEYLWDGEKWIFGNADWQRPRGPGTDISKKGDHPVIHVSWDDAVSYCKWTGRRLPTEAEWEKAARGTDGRIYPWGNDNPSIELVNFDAIQGDTTPVGSYPNGASPYGALDMAGNVLEWVNDWYSQPYYQSSPSSNPMGPRTGDFRVLRGGSWEDGDDTIRSFSRSSDVQTRLYGYSGFRCALGASQ